jgi:exonuclease III
VFDFDIAIIPESEKPALVNFPEEFISKYHYCWRGKSKYKGIGLFAKKQIFSFESNRQLEQEDLQYVVLKTITSQNAAFALHAIWACQANTSTFRYIGQVWQYLNRNKDMIDYDNSIFAGDFNSNSRWDAHHQHGNHSDVVKLLNDRNVSSAYHAYHDEQQGKESINTFYLQKNTTKGYHIDYFFLPNRLIPKITKMHIGKGADWLQYSDHMPMYLEVR